MAFISDLEDKVRDFLDGDYEITETQNIPSVENVPFKKKAVKMNLIAYSIDLRKSSDLLFKHHKTTSGKIHKAFLTIASKVARNYGGEIRSFQGDCILIFWPAHSQSQIMTAVKTAMVTKWLLDIRFSKYFEKYDKLDFGIGIDWSEVYILKAGISRNANNNDLVFIGKSVNFATAIANQVKAPNHIGVSSNIFENLDENFRYSTRPAKFWEESWYWNRIYRKDGKSYLKADLWEDGIVIWNDERYKCKITSSYIALD